MITDWKKFTGKIIRQNEHLMVSRSPEDDSGSFYISAFEHEARELPVGTIVSYEGGYPGQRRGVAQKIVAVNGDNMTVKDKLHLFYGGPFSQWYRCRFTEDGITYNGTEQYMMSKKAIFFNDTESYDLIMNMRDPRDQKAQGKKVKNFNKEQWENYCRPMVRQGNLLKFSQNPELKQYLLATGDTEIVEASPTDTIWGIGLAENDPRAYDKTQWRGTNWLGIAIMEVREELRKNT